MACGHEPAGDDTVHRTAAPAAPVVPTTAAATTEEVPAASSSFPWAIVGAGVAALVLVALVVAVVVSRGGSEPDDVASGAGPSSTTTTGTTPTSSTTATTAPATTAPAPPITAAPTAPPTTLPPKPVGIDCPSGAPATGSVVVRDAGSNLGFRRTPDPDDESIDIARPGETVRYWTTPGDVLFDEATYRTSVKAQLPRNPSSCGWVNASNINLPLQSLGSPQPDDPTGCHTYEAPTVAVHVCDRGDGPTFEVVWKAEPSASRTIGSAAPDGGGWKAQAAGSDHLFYVDNSILKITKNGAPVFRDDIGDVHDW